MQMMIRVCTCVTTPAMYYTNMYTNLYKDLLLKYTCAFTCTIEAQMQLLFSS